MPSDFSVRHRHSRWQTLYVRGPYWQDWHAFLIGHNPVGPAVAVTTQELSGIWNKSNQDTVGSRHLRRFESRTILGYLPRNTNLHRIFLDCIAVEAIDKQNNLWHDLSGHYRSHGCGGELSILDAAAAAIRAAAAAIPGMDDQTLATYFPGHVDSQETYGMLAVGALALTQFLDGLNGFCDLSFLCPDAPERHSLSVVLAVSEHFIERHTGRPGGHGIRVGVTVAGVDRFLVGTRHFEVPWLHPAFALSTCFAPDRASTTKLRMSGYATTITLT